MQELIFQKSFATPSTSELSRLGSIKTEERQNTTTKRAVGDCKKELDSAAIRAFQECLFGSSEKAQK